MKIYGNISEILNYKKKIVVNKSIRIAHFINVFILILQFFYEQLLSVPSNLFIILFILVFQLEFFFMSINFRHDILNGNIGDYFPSDILPGKYLSETGKHAAEALWFLVYTYMTKMKNRKTIRNKNTLRTLYV